MLKTAKLPLKVLDEKVDQTSIAFPVPKNNPALVKQINQAIEDMKKDGTLTKISTKWFGIDITK
jgi:cystine transport system substrate-binding protein